jgi:alpha-tubulin suppressor-like RCC1 family protein
MWGLGTHGALGTVDSKTLWLPEAIPATKRLFVTDVECGTLHTSILTAKRKAFLWGTIQRGNITPPSKLEMGNAVAIAAGDHLQMILDGYGEVHTLSMSRVKRGRLAPGLVKDLRGTNISKVSCGQYFAAVSSRGVLYLWHKGQKPTRVSGLVGVKSISFGHEFALAAVESGAVYAWGANTVG